MFELTEIADGVYTVKSESTGRFLSYNPTRKVLYFTDENVDDPMQQWIVYDSGDGQLQFISRPKATAVAIANGSTTSGARLSLVENNLRENSLWQLEAWPPTGILDEGLRMKDESNNPSSLISHPSSIYDLQGRKIIDNGQWTMDNFNAPANSQLKPGIYIRNGKKIVLK